MTGMTTSTSTLARHYDVIIAGARVAGASTAMLLARAGMRVLMVDPRPPSRDTLSTHALMRGAVRQLHRWGLLDEVLAHPTPLIRTTAFDYGQDEIVIPIKEGDGLSGLIAPRRTVLDPLLNRAAARAGADVVYGTRVADLCTDPAGRIVGAVLTDREGGRATVGADLVVGADGRNSRVARLACARTERVSRHATASIYAYLPTEGDAEDRYTWRFAPGSRASVQFRSCALSGRPGRSGGRGEPGVMMGEIPTNGGESCVFASTAPLAFKAAGRRGMAQLFRTTVARMNPGLADRIAEIPGLVLRGFAGERGTLRRPVGRGWALVGDAGHFRDPCTAHGITDALRDAEGLARAALEGTTLAMDRYSAERNEACIGLFETTDAIAALDWNVDQVQLLHQELSRQMNRGVEQIQSWEGLPARLSPPVPG